MMMMLNYEDNDLDDSQLLRAIKKPGKYDNTAKCGGWERAKGNWNDKNGS